jgi:hypothetical protein
MRSSLTLGSVALLALLAACGTDPAIGDDDDGMGSGSGSGSGSGTPDLEPPARGFQMKSPEITIKAGEEITYCWYFKTPNTEQYTIKRWVSHSPKAPCRRAAADSAAARTSASGSTRRRTKTPI